MPTEASAEELVEGEHAAMVAVTLLLLARQRALVRATADLIDARIRARLSDGPWTRARMNMVMATIRVEFRRLSSSQRRSFMRGMVLSARRAHRSTALFITRMDARFLGSKPKLDFENSSWFGHVQKRIGRTRLRQYTRSFDRYTAGTVGQIEKAIRARIIMGQPWESARGEVGEIVRDIARGRRWWVDRIVRTETSQAWNSMVLSAIMSEDRPGQRMGKKLVATFDAVTGRDSIALDGQVRPVNEPFFDSVNGITYMAPPNRPNDREAMVPWRPEYRVNANVERVRRARTGRARHRMEAQLASMRGKRRIVIRQLRARRLAMTAHRARIRGLERAGSAVPGRLADSYRHEAELVHALTGQLDEYSTWIADLRLRVSA